MCGASAFVGLQPCKVPLQLVKPAVSAQHVHVVVHAKLPSREFCASGDECPCKGTFVTSRNPKWHWRNAS